jgi:hypothetical protein
MAGKYVWTCGECGFDNKPHAFRQGDKANQTCEQCGADRDDAEVS